MSVRRENRGVVIRAVFPVLWVLEPTAEYDAGLHSNGHLSTCDAPKFCRLSRQGDLDFIKIVHKN